MHIRHSWLFLFTGEMESNIPPPTMSPRDFQRKSQAGKGFANGYIQAGRDSVVEKEKDLASKGTIFWKI